MCLAYTRLSDCHHLQTREIQIWPIMPQFCGGQSWCGADYLLVVVVAVVLSGANVVGYTKCSKQASAQLRSYATQAVTSGLTVWPSPAFEVSSCQQVETWVPTWLF